MIGLMVSVVVPTCRRPRLLEQCLQALMDQTFPSQGYEVIVVDDDPKDPATRALVTEWQARLQVNSIFQPITVSLPVPVTGAAQIQTVETGAGYPVANGPNQGPRLVYLAVTRNGGPAAARNLGWRAAQGEIIAFTDDDCLPEPDWLANGVAAFGDGEAVAGVSGQVIVPLIFPPTDHELNYTGLSRSDFITANCFYRRSVLQAVGGFDERFAAAWREDSDLYFTVHEKNYPLIWSSTAVVLHPVQPVAWGSSLRSQKKSFYNALIYKKHPALYWKIIQPSPPWRYYITLAALLGTLAGLVSGSAALAGISFGLWLYLSAAFALSRLKYTSHAPSHVLEMVVTSLFIPILSVYWRLRGALHWQVWFL